MTRLLLALLALTGCATATPAPAATVTVTPAPVVLLEKVPGPTTTVTVQARAARSADRPATTVWDRLAWCESTGRWDANTGNGFTGGLQFAQTSWEWVGGLAFAPRADLATKAQQITAAKRLLARQGWGAWPACSRLLGLTGGTK